MYHEMHGTLVVRVYFRFTRATARSMLHGRLGMASAAGAASVGTFRSGFADYADGEFHILKGDVFADGGDEMLGHRVRRHSAVELEADGLADEVREGIRHLAVEREAEVGVHFFLKLEDALLGAVPRARLHHDEDGLTRLAVECEGVETARIFDTEGVRIFGIGLGRLVLAAGIAHNAKGWTSSGDLSKTALMKAILVRAFGGPEVLELCETPDLQPGPGQVLVRLMAAGVNPVEAYIRSGAYAKLPELPFTPGSDGAGVVVSVGADVDSRLRPGQRVWVTGRGSGTYAEAALCETGGVFALPDDVTFEQGAALGIPYATAYRALFQRGGAKAGETVLVHGATGGVGVAAVQFAKAAGLRVLATGGSEDGRRLLAALGADAVFDHNAANFADAIRSETGGKGVDVILEMLANVNLARDLALLGRNGRVLVIGNRGSIEINPRDLMLRDADIRGVMLANTPAAELAECHAAINSALAVGKISPVIGKTLPLAQAAEAHRIILGHGHRGKVILQTGSPK